MADQEILFTHDPAAETGRLISEAAPDRVFLLTDETTERLCRPLVAGGPSLQSAGSIVIGATDTHKGLETLAEVWRRLCEGGASRHSLLVCLGGGMVTDLGGFAASTFKRGIRYINVPTTLLAMVDAAVGGKTGINFNGLKNEIGVFNKAQAVVVDTSFLRTLDAPNLRSGYAEMLKHGLISHDGHWAELLRFDLAAPDLAVLQGLVASSIQVKEDIVRQDPLERGLRKALNFGHTLGHAFESLALAEERPVLHGYAVAWGMVGELYLSCRRAGFPQSKLKQTVDYIRQHYGTFRFTCDHYARLYDLMTHDKKNVGGVINFTLLADVGDLRLDQTATRDEVYDVFDFFRETMN